MSKQLDDQADEIITRLYKRFKGWHRRGFGPEDVTWCEVKADILELIAMPRSAPALEPDEFRVMNLVMFVRRLAHRLKKIEPGNAAARQALTFLERHGLHGSPLRAESAEESCAHATTTFKNGDELCAACGELI